MKIGYKDHSIHNKTKVGRNDPCPCGTGVKFKYCCLPKMLKAERKTKKMGNEEQEKTALTNKFREELEKKQAEHEAQVNALTIETTTFGETEMMKRDQYATMLQLQVQKRMMAQDKEHCEKGIVQYEEFLKVLEGLPLSAAKAGIIKMITQQLADLTMQAAIEFHRPNQVQLNALEQIFGKPDIEIGSGADETSTTTGPAAEGEDDPDDFSHLDDAGGEEQNIDTDEASEELADDVEADAAALAAAKAEQESS